MRVEHIQIDTMHADACEAIAQRRFLGWIKDIDKQENGLAEGADETRAPTWQEQLFITETLQSF